MMNHFFNEQLQKVNTRIVPSNHPTRFLLDKNEQSDDVPAAFKARVLETLMQSDWNRYPSADLRDMECKVAAYCGMSPENIVLSAGSASMITTLLDYFALNQKHIVINQPSYSLFDYHCKTYNIPYQPWMLTGNLEYDFKNLPALGPNSVLIITSPNNPVGNALDLDHLEELLVRFPDALIVLDGVYCEFCAFDPTPLVNEYPNLVVLRSFSKAFPMAGLRLGYLCAAPQMASVIKKLVLQFSINHFTLAFARVMFEDQDFMAGARRKVQEIIAERERLYGMISRRFGKNAVHVFKSEGNFLLIRVFDTAAFEKLMGDLNLGGIKVLNTSGFPLMLNTFRVSIGNKNENDAFLHGMAESFAMPDQALETNKVFVPAQTRYALGSAVHAA